MARCTAQYFLDAVRRGASVSHLDVLEHIHTARSLDGRLAIHEAVLRNCVDRVRDLVELGADVNAVSHSGRTAVQMAAESPRHAYGVGNNDERMVCYLLSLPQADFALAGPGTRPAIESIVARYSGPTVAAALDHQIYEDPSGTLLYLIVLINSVGMIHRARSRLSHCNFNAFTPKRKSLLYAAAESSCASSVEYLVTHTDADPCFVYHETPVPGLHNRQIPLHITGNDSSVLDKCVSLVSAPCIREMVRRGARIISNIDAISSLIRTRDPHRILPDLLRTITPSAAICTRIINAAHDDIYAPSVSKEDAVLTRRLRDMASLYISVSSDIDVDEADNNCTLQLDVAIHDQLLRGKSLPFHPHLRWDYEGDPDACDLSPLVRAALQPWAPSRHAHLFSRYFRLTVAHVYLAWALTPVHMPPEMWLFVIGMLSREWFPLEAPPFTHPHRDAAHPHNAAWRAALA